jgi:NAD(P)-dependent dehydrogenase (short-subunit alcohol dehydrogenase family)
MTSTPVAIVAGAGGAGAATAQALASAGFHVVVLDSRPESAMAAVEPLLAAGLAAESHGIDLLDADAVVALRDDLVARLGRADVLVHLVGGWRGTKSLDLSSVDNWTALHPPVVGTLAVLTAVFGEQVRSAATGRIFMVTSTTAARPTAGNIAYAAAKRAAEAWMEGVADYFKDANAAAVTVAVKALLTDRMQADEPDKTWTGYTHVRDLATAIAGACTGPVANGQRLDLTAGPPES